MATPTKWGSEININTITMINDTEAQITALANGQFVVVWTEFLTDGPGEFTLTVRSQLFGANGSKIGPESVVFQDSSLLNPSAEIPHPHIAARPDGGYVVTWNSEVGGPA